MKLNNSRIDDAESASPVTLDTHPSGTVLAGAPLLEDQLPSSRLIVLKNAVLLRWRRIMPADCDELDWRNRGDER